MPSYVTALCVKVRVERCVKPCVSPLRQVCALPVRSMSMPVRSCRVELCSGLCVGNLLSFLCRVPV